MTGRRGLAVGLAAFFLLLAGAPGARADGLDRLEQEFEVVARRRDERGFEKQHSLLIEIADVKTPQARKCLVKIRDKWARRNWRRAGLILEALVRHAGPKDVDRAIAWAEKQHDALLLERLGDALGRTHSPTARRHLRGDALRRATPPVKAQIARALGMLREVKAVPELLPLVKESHLRTRVEALHALGEIGDRLATAPLIVFLRDERWEVRDAAARALGRMKDPKALSALEGALHDENPRVVESAARGLGRLGEADAIEGLIACLGRVVPADLRVADAVADALDKITGKYYGFDADLWQEWWNGAKDKPFLRDETPMCNRTMPGLPYYGFRIHSSRVVFVIDQSQSMDWNERLEKAKKELIHVLEHIQGDAETRENMRFNIVAYSDGVHAWEKKIRPARTSTVKKAVRFIRRLSPQRGTNTYEALRLALDDPDADSVFFLSDGSPSVGPVIDPDRILAEVGVWNRYKRMRIHCIALLIGDPPMAFAGQEDERRAIAFMERLAEQNGGHCEVIRKN